MPTTSKTIKDAQRQVSRLARENPSVSPWHLVALAAAEIRQTAPELAQVLAPALLKGWVDSARKLAREARVEHAGPPERPLPISTSPYDPVRWPAIEESVADLVRRAVITWPEYQSLSQQAQATAFTVARTITETGVERVRHAVQKTIEEGRTLKQFAKEVGPVMAKAGLRSDQVETVFRDSVGQAVSAGMRAVIRHPAVAIEFPYALYSATHDSRVRPLHLLMEKLGIQKTAVYRMDDPELLRHWPPWDYRCRCAITPLSIADAAAYGIKEAMIWQRTGIPPVTPAWVPPIPFGPPPGWPTSDTGIKSVV